MRPAGERRPSLRPPREALFVRGPSAEDEGAVVVTCALAQPRAAAFPRLRRRRRLWRSFGCERRSPPPPPPPSRTGGEIAGSACPKEKGSSENGALIRFPADCGTFTSEACSRHFRFAADAGGRRPDAVGRARECPDRRP